MIYNSITELVGNTPMLKLGYINNANVYAKLEYLNPAGSIKDRVALYMINDAIKNNLINENSTIIEPTSGNTGIGLCAIAAKMGLKSIIVMPDTMSIERINLMKAYGAEVILTDGKLGMSGAIKKANELASQIEGSFIPNQFNNKSNPKAHYETTGKEIYNDLDGKVDVLVCGVGTGGTITGIGTYLKEKNPNIKIYAVEPKGSNVLSGGKAGAHGLQGIGAGFIPTILDVNLYDDVITITEDEAYKESRLFAKKEGILVGISSGAALAAVKKIKDNHKNENIVVILPDTGDRYLSTKLFVD